MTFNSGAADDPGCLAQYRDANVSECVSTLLAHSSPFRVLVTFSLHYFSCAGLFLPLANIMIDSAYRSRQAHVPNQLLVRYIGTAHFKSYMWTSAVSYNLALLTRLQYC